MSVFHQIDGYCERTDFTMWSEPVNAATNAAFIVAAIIMWRRSAGLPLARGLCALLFAIGVGSFLFHTFATVWGAMADTIPILGFILLYIYVANHAYWGLSRLWSGIGVAAFFPFAALVGWGAAQVPFLAISAAYWPVAVLIAAYAVGLRRRLPRVAVGLAMGVAMLCASLVFRSLDELVCVHLPLGTHFMWHILNGVMLGWMIEVYVRHAHMLAGMREGR